MKLRNHWPLDLLLIACVVLGVRLAWILTNSTTGWNVHLDHWATACASLFGVETTRLSNATPDLQARFWLNQVSRIKSGDKDSQVAMGAAWMLDSPQFGFTQRHLRTLKKLDFPGAVVGWRPNIDIDAIRTLTEEFESICHHECLSRIETATRLDSGNLDLWRARALLSFRRTYGRLDSKPRHDDWLSVLNLCAEHDPGNALYDYLAALHLWSSSAEYDSDEHGWVLKTKNRPTFDQGSSRLAAGLAKRDLKFVKSGYAATMAFLGASSLHCLDQLTAAESRSIDSRATDLLYLIVRWQSVQVDDHKRNKNFATAVASIRTMLRISDQLSEASDDPNLGTTQLILRRWGLANLKEINEQQPNLLDIKEAAQVSADLDQVRLDLEVLEEIGKRLAATTGEEDRQKHGGAAFVVLMAAQQFVIVALSLLLIFGFVGRVLGAVNHDDRVGIGWMKHVVAWLVGIGVSWALLGMYPAEVVSHRVNGAANLDLTPLDLLQKTSPKEMKWVWAFIQWQRQLGVIAASVIAVGVIFIWSLIRQSRCDEETRQSEHRNPKRRLTRQACDDVARSCAVTALILALACLTVAPTVVERQDEYQKLHYQRLINTSQTQREIEAIKTQVTSDKALMTKLRAEIAERPSKNSEQSGQGDE